MAEFVSCGLEIVGTFNRRSCKSRDKRQNKREDRKDFWGKRTAKEPHRCLGNENVVLHVKTSMERLNIRLNSAEKRVNEFNMLIQGNHFKFSAKR